MTYNLNLGAEDRERINAILDGCFWNACFADKQTLIGAAAIELIGVLFEDQQPGDAYPVTLVCHPVNRVAASYQVDGHAQALDIEDLDSALQEFNFREIDDWDIIDPPPGKQIRWRDKVSLDVSLSAGKDEHLLEMWQDESPFQTLNVAFWFQELFLLDAKLNPLSLKDLESASEQGKRAATRGWLRTGAVPSFSADALLDKITG